MLDVRARYLLPAAGPCAAVSCLSCWCMLGRCRSGTQLRKHCENTAKISAKVGSYCFGVPFLQALLSKSPKISISEGEGDQDRRCAVCMTGELETKPCGVIELQLRSHAH